MFPRVLCIVIPSSIRSEYIVQINYITTLSIITNNPGRNILYNLTYRLSRLFTTFCNRIIREKLLGIVACAWVGWCVWVCVGVGV